MAKGKKKQGAEATDAAPAVPSASISGHPRARAAIRRARARASFVVFVLVLLLGHKAGLAWFDATWRGLVAGLAANLIAWRCAIYVWRQVIVAEMRRAEEVYAERRRQALETLEKRRAEQADFHAA
jgi:hypothetical protein